MPLIEANGIELYYEIRGAGSPLILINGWGGNLSSWSSKMVDLLTEKHRVIMMDNRGTGRSSKPDIPYTMDMMVADTIAVLEAVGVDKAHVMGFSMGGIVAQAFGLKYPQKTLSLILCGTQPGEDHRISSDPSVYADLAVIANPLPGMTERNRTIKLLYLLYPTGYVKANLEALIKDETYEEYPTPSYALTRQSEAIAGFDSYDMLPEMSYPVLVMAGTEDKLVLPENSKVLTDLILDATLVMIHGCGHGFLKQETEEAVWHILRFLDRVDN